MIRKGIRVRALPVELLFGQGGAGATAAAAAAAVEGFGHGQVLFAFLALVGGCGRHLWGREGRVFFSVEERRGKGFFAAERRGGVEYVCFLAGRGVFCGVGVWDLVGLKTVFIDKD